MVKITLHCTYQISKLFILLNISNNDLLKEQDLLFKIASDKENALSENDFEKAANLRNEEVKKIHDIVSLLNSKKIANNNQLIIDLVFPEDVGDAI